MTAPARADRRALRRRDPAALATVLVGQLVAYRCSTIYAPSTTRLDAFVRAEVLPRLREHLDVRAVIVEQWATQGPTVAQLVAEIHRQLDIEPGGPDTRPLAALESVLRRAERRSDRPLLIVLYRLELLLDDRRDRAEVARFVDALARMAASPMLGLHLVLGVQEEDLGAFRELLRGRWRLLANDIRIKPGGRRWLLSLPLLLGAWLSSHLVPVTAVGAVCVGSGAAIGTVVTTRACDDTRVALADCTTEVDRLRRAPPPRPPPPEPPPDPTTTTLEDPTGDPETSAAIPDPDPVPVLPRTDLCSPAPRDGACGKCVRASCCSALQTCKRPKWRTCVLKGRIGQGACTPDAIEKECRALALCALEYTCRPACFPG